MICKNCGNDVQPRMSQEQLLIFIVLLIFAVIPGVAYFFLCNKTTCPICGKDIYNKSSTSSPVSSTTESKPAKTTTTKTAKTGEEK